MQKLDLSKILKLNYSSNHEENDLVYKTGQALVMYLQEKHPNLLSDYLSAVRGGDSHKLQGFLNKAISYDDDFKSWLTSNNTETAMREINALQVTKGEYIATKKEIVDGEIKDVSYYRAEIQTMDEERVGSFSPVKHTSFSEYIRASNATHHLDISGKYSFLKVVNTSDGKKLTYSDQHGSEYKDSQEYKLKALGVLSDYGEDLRQYYRNKHQELRQELEKEHRGELENLDRQKQAEYEEGLNNFRERIDAQLRDISEKYNNREISYQEYAKEHNSITANYRDSTKALYSTIQDKYVKLKGALPDMYEESRNSLLDEMIMAGSEKVKTATGTDIEKILEELIYINPNLIRSTRSIDLEEGHIFNLQAHGKGMDGALSLYDGKTKLGELLSETGFFSQVVGSDKEIFFFEDNLHGLYTIL